MFSNEFIIDLINQYGLILVLGIAIFEGPIVSVITGYLLRLGHFDWAMVMLVLVAADLLGDALMYWIGSHGQTKSIAKWRRMAGLTDERMTSLEEEFEQHGFKYIIFGKVTHAPGMAVNLAAGMSRMNFGKFMLFSAIGTIPKTFVFVLMGYVLGTAFGKAENYIFNYSIIGGIIITGAVVAFLLHRYRKSQDK